MAEPIHRSTTDGPVIEEKAEARRRGPQAEHNFDLLDILKHRTTEDYHDIYFKTGDVNPAAKMYRPRVLFDTINIGYDDDEERYTAFNEDHSWQVGDHALFNRRDSPNLGLERGRLMLPGRDDPEMMELARMLSQLRPVYPTTPIITFRGATVARVHRQWDDLYKGRLNNPEHGFRKPILPNRVILVYISGRRHTWVALDWILRLFIEDGDTVVVVSAIDNKQMLKQRRGTTGWTLPRKHLHPQQPMTARMRLRMRNSPEYMTTLSNDVMRYMMEVINPDKIARVCLELCVGKTKEVLREMYKLYEPNLACTATKVNLGVTAPLRAWNLRKITDQMVLHFPLPLVVVLPMNMARYEHTLEEDIDARYGTTPDPVEQSPYDQWDPEASDVASVDLMELLNLEDLYLSYEEISKIYWDYKKDMRRQITRLKKEPRDDEFFANFLRLISDKLVALCNELHDVNPDFKGKGAKVARAITGSNAFGAIPYKTKSLLEPEKPLLEKTKLQNAVSYQETMRALRSRSATPAEAPKIQVHSPLAEHTPPPKHRDIKFADPEIPEKRNGGLSLSQLKKSLSHEVAEHTRPQLEPLRSHPDIHTVLHHHSNGSSPEPEDKKKNKGRFWSKLFK